MTHARGKRQAMLSGAILAIALFVPAGPGAVTLAAGQTAQSPAAEAMLAAAVPIEQDVREIHQSLTKAATDRASLTRDLATEAADITAQRAQEQAEASLPLSSPPLCTEVQSIDQAYGVEQAAFYRVQQDSSAFVGAAAVYNADLETLGVEVIRLSGDIANLMAAIEQNRGHKMPKIPVNLYGKDNVKDLVKVVGALIKATRLLPDTLARRNKALMTQATSINRAAANVDTKAHAQGCT